MALSGSVSSSTYDSVGIKLTWSATQNVGKNQSTIKWTLKSYGRKSNEWWMSGNFKVVIDGSTVYSSSTRIKMYGNGATTIASGSKTLTHNNDGSKSFKVSIEAGIYTVAVNCSGSKTFTLDKIARNPNAPTAVSITAGHGNYVGLGDTVTIKWSGASGVITGYQIQYSRGNSGWKEWSAGNVTSTATSGSKTDSFTATDININGAGNAVKYRVRAMNGTLASAWKESNTLYISGVMKAKVSGAWKKGSTWVKVSGSWKRAKRVWVKVSGTWKESV